jgi:hypothetical protein
MARVPGFRMNLRPYRLRLVLGVAAATALVAAAPGWAWTTPR